MVSNLWEKLTARCVDRHRNMELTLERLLEVQGAMGELCMELDQAEGVRDAWEPVGDLFIDSLQDHIDATKVSQSSKHPYTVQSICIWTVGTISVLLAL